MRERAVTNSTCLIGLDRIGRSDVLQRSFGEVLAPPEVMTEVGLSIGWIVTRATAQPAVTAALRMQVGLGEAAAIALALELVDVEIVLDDRKARRVARELGLNVLGTVGLMVRAKRAGIIERVGPVLSELEASGFRLTPALVGEALRLAGE